MWGSSMAIELEIDKRKMNNNDNKGRRHKKARTRPRAIALLGARHESRKNDTEVKNSWPTEIQILRKLAFENGAANAYYNMLAEQEERSE